MMLKHSTWNAKIIAFMYTTVHTSRVSMISFLKVLGDIFDKKYSENS